MRRDRGDADLTPAVAERLAAAVASGVRAALEEQLPQLAPQGAVLALEAAQRCYEAELIAALAAAAKVDGDIVLERVLLRYFDRARRELEALGRREPLADLVTEGD